GLLAGAADVALGDPPVAKFQAEPADHGAVGQGLVVVLPVLDAEDVVEAVLDHAGIHIGQGHGAAAAACLGRERAPQLVQRAGPAPGSAPLPPRVRTGKRMTWKTWPSLRWRRGLG